MSTATNAAKHETSRGRLAGKVAIVTGGASGMGRASVERFLAEQAAVVIADLNAESGRSLVEELSAQGFAQQVRFVRTDVSVEQDIAALVDFALTTFGQLDVMFNNAGIGGAFGPITELEADAWDETFAVLVRSVFLGIKHAARAMINQSDASDASSASDTSAASGGSIINTASIAGLGGGAGPQAYSAAKAAVINLSATTALELAPHRIRVNAICPGLIFTPLMHSGNEAQAEEVMTQLQPWPGRGEGVDIAAMALFLASDESQFVSGQAHVVDGALLAAGSRLFGQIDNTRNLHRMSGMAYGTTGKQAKVRRL